jgi:hypothetical protein
VTADNSVGSIRVEPSTLTENLGSSVDILIHLSEPSLFFRTGKAHFLKGKEKFIIPRASDMGACKLLL